MVNNKSRISGERKSKYIFRTNNIPLQLIFSDYLIGKPLSLKVPKVQVPKVRKGSKTN